MKDNKNKIEYYPQVQLEQCLNKHFFNNVLICKDLEFTDTEPDSKNNESEEEFNENTLLDE